ncbi:ESPR-type extended signal peptide-containing protein [Paraburkholderia saeva]|uniref:Autotransporter adhesin SadA n=1 Tax=Paraburkholderia saeva TaxID=2777537 RepID=A0A9N8X216_9BURK|nr:ESPR-type extended signal peptide-containing protein [Paraburkholderia saeva]CAG4898032.1 Autotransporter adhesin SadA [Paraburkholderia saeva]CAG4925026.1 Autotransporter adhesin SadA [Paraburkholderia saeva]
MNKSHRVVWNDVTNTWVAVSELATARRSKASRRAGVAAAIVGLGAMALVPAAGAAEPEDGRQMQTMLASLLAAPAAAQGPVLTAAPDPTIYIAVSPNVTQGNATHAGDAMNAMAIGPVSSAIGENSSAIGAGSFAAYDGSTAVGALAGALALNATAIGSGATTGSDADNSVSIGRLARTFGANTLALGGLTIAHGIDSASIGTNAFTAVGADRSMALGANAAARVNDSVALGSASVADREFTVSVGNSTTQRQIVNVAGGTQDSDAVNVTQLKGVINAMGGGAALNPDGSMTPPTYTVAGDTYTNVGDAITHVDGAVTNVTNVVNNIQNGGGIKYMHVNSVLDDSSAEGVESAAIGGNARATADNSVAVGANAVADRANTVSIGAVGNERQLANVAAGTADTDAVNMWQLRQAGINTDGDGNVTNAFVTYDDTSKGHITLGGADAAGPVGISNLKAGAVAESSRDAINGGQFYGLASSVADAIGGGASVNPDGTMTGPTYNIGGDTYTNIGDAITHMDGAVTNVTNVVNNIQNGGGIKYMHVNSVLDDSSAEGVESAAIGGNARATADNSVAVGANAVADRANTVSIGAVGNERQLANVAAGTADTDAVNMWQLRQAGINTDGDGNVTNAFVTYDDTSKGHITLGGADAAGPVGISNLKAGAVAENSGDAVNGGQLYNLANSVASAMGGGSSVTQDGIISPPTFTVGGDTYQSVGDAITHIDGDMTNVMNVVNNIQNGVGIKYFQTHSTLADAVASGDESIAIGGNAQASADNSVALGANATTTADLTQAAYRPGSGQVAGANPVGEVSVGSAGNERRVTNVAAGAADTDAVNVSQLKTVVAGSVADAVMYDNPDHSGITLGGPGSTTPVHLGNVASGQVVANSTDATNGGQMYNLASTVADALGGGTAVNPDGSITQPTYNIGGDTYHNISDVVTNIDGRVTNNTNEISNLTQILNNITNTGVNVKYVHVNSTGADSVASGADAVAIGGNAQASFDNSVAIGANSTTNRVNSVSVGSAGNERQITNVAAGTADTDAVNVAQLKQAGVIDGNGNTKTAVTYDTQDGATDYASVTLGNGAAGGTVLHHVGAGTLDSDAVNLGQLNDALGRISNDIASGGSPFLSVNGDRDNEPALASGTHATALGANAVANGTDAVALGANTNAIGNGATVVGSGASVRATNATALGWGSSATADGSVALGAGSVADRANSISVGSVGAERQITNVAPGTQGTDAVNVNQLNAALGQTSQSIQDLDRSTRKGIAAASALQIVTPYLPGRTTLNAGVAGYRGQAALGLGVSRWNEKGTINFNAGVASSGSTSTIVRAGIGIVLGD